MKSTIALLPRPTSLLPAHHISSCSAPTLSELALSSQQAPVQSWESSATLPTVEFIVSNSLHELIERNSISQAGALAESIFIDVDSAKMGFYDHTRAKDQTTTRTIPMYVYIVSLQVAPISVSKLVSRSFISTGSMVLLGMDTPTAQAVRTDKTMDVAVELGLTENSERTTRLSQYLHTVLYVQQKFKSFNRPFFGYPRIIPRFPDLPVTFSDVTLKRVT